MSYMLTLGIIIYFLSSSFIYYETVKVTRFLDKELERGKSAFSDSLSKTLALYIGTFALLTPTWFHFQRLFIDGDYFIIGNRVLVFVLALATCFLVSSTITYPIVRYNYNKLIKTDVGVD